MVGDDFVNVVEGDVFDIHELSTDFVHRVIFMDQDSIRELVQMRQREDRVVVLDYHLNTEE